MQVLHNAWEKVDKDGHTSPFAHSSIIDNLLLRPNHGVEIGLLELVAFVLFLDTLEP